MKYFNYILNQSPIVSSKFDKTIGINWAALLSMAIFWLYAVNRYPAGSSINNNFLDTLIILVYVFLLFNYSNPVFRVRLNVRLPWMLTLIFLVAAVIITWRHLNQPLWGDQIYHANLAARHGQLAIFMIEQRAPGLWRYIENVQVSYIVMAANLLITSVFVLLFYVVPKFLARFRYIFVVVMVLALILGRYFLSGGENIFSEVNGPYFMLNSFGLSDPHPLFRLFPLVVTSAFFGASDFGFRLAAFLGYLTFLIFVFLRLNNNPNWLLALFATLAVGTIPILWHVSYLVEQSAWAAIASASIFLFFISSKSLDDAPLVPLTAFVILATLLRSPAFVAFTPLALVIGYRMFKGSITKNEILPLIVLIVTLGMFIAISAVRGSPATETIGTFAKWIFSASNNIPAVAAASVIGLLPLFFIGFIFRANSTNRFILMLAALLFFFLCSYLYYAPLVRYLWGVGRYQAEIFVPLIVAGIAAYCMDSRELRPNFSLLAVVPLAVLLSINCFSIHVMDNRTYKPFEAAPPPGEGVKAEIEYPMNEAFDYIRSSNQLKSTYYIGIYYGGFISALRGYTASEYLAFSSINNRHRSGWVINLDGLNEDYEITSVIVEPEADAGAIEGLSKRGWQGRRDFTNAATGRKLIVLSRHKI